MTVTKAVTGFDDNLMGVVGCQWRSLNRLATLLTRLVGLGEEATFTGTVARAPAPLTGEEAPGLHQFEK